MKSSLSKAGIQDVFDYKFSNRHHDGGFYGDMTLVKHLDDGTASDFYTVYKRPHTLLDFIFANETIQGYPESVFRKKNRAAQNGSKVIEGKIFGRKIGTELFEEEITTNKRLYEILTGEYNMVVPKLTFSTDFPREWF